LSDKWAELYLDALMLDPNFNLEIPIEPLPGEDAMATVFRYFEDQGIFQGDPAGQGYVNFERAEEVDPNIAKFFRAIQAAEVAEMADTLEEDGYIYTSVNSKGEMVYGLTEAGKKYVEEMRAEDNQL
jgi:hypothetical protein